jgi:hypothetical protein
VHAAALPKRRLRPGHLEWVMQAEGEVVQLPEQRVATPKDFRTFFED